MFQINSFKVSIKALFI